MSICLYTSGIRGHGVGIRIINIMEHERNTGELFLID